MLRRQIVIDLDEFHTSQFQAALFQTRRNLPDQATLHRIGFENNQRSFHRNSPRV